MARLPAWLELVGPAKGTLASDRRSVTFAVRLVDVEAAARWLNENIVNKTVERGGLLRSQGGGTGGRNDARGYLARILYGSGTFTRPRLMAGRGPAPKATRRRANAPSRGEWAPTPGTGWQHGDPPAPPTGLLKASRDAWATWMHAWFAAHWTPEDLPALRQAIRIYDQVERGEFVRAGELRLWLDTLGISPKGWQDRRWSPLAADPVEAPSSQTKPSRYSHLRTVINS
jgi:hypothetical protein